FGEAAIAMVVIGPVYGIVISLPLRFFCPQYTPAHCTKSRDCYPVWALSAVAAQEREAAFYGPGLLSGEEEPYPYSGGAGPSAYLFIAVRMTLLATSSCALGWGIASPRGLPGVCFLRTYIGGLRADFSSLSLCSCAQDGQKGSSLCSPAPQL